jgi:ATP-dependent Lon protease
MALFDEFFGAQGFEDEGDFIPLISIEEEDEKTIQETYSDILPILALKNTVLFPGIVIPITVGRDKSIKAINKAYEKDRIIAVVSQRDSKVENPNPGELYQVGAIARIIKLIRMPDGTTTAILQGRKRFRIQSVLKDDPYMEGVVNILTYEEPSHKLEFEALISSIIDKAQQIIELSPSIPSEAVVMLRNINSHSFLLNFIASNLGVKVHQKQHLLETNNLYEKAKEIFKLMDGELQLLELKDQIESKVRTDIEKQQRDYFLSQQLKTIQEELGQNPRKRRSGRLSNAPKRKSGIKPSPKPSKRNSANSAA